MTTPAPWERQPGETAPAWRAFATYRDQALGERSLAAVGRTLGRSGGLVERWSSRWSWVERVRAWDNEADRLHRQSLVRQRRLARVRHLKTSDTALAIVEAQLDLARLRTEAGEPMKDSDVIRLMTAAVSLQREVLGEVMAVDVTSGGQPISTVSVASPESVAEAREELQRLHAEVNRRLTDLEQPAEPSDPAGAA